MSRSASFKGTSTPTTRTPTYTLQDVKPTHQDELGTILVLSVDGQPLCTVLKSLLSPMLACAMSGCISTVVTLLRAKAAANKARW